MTPQEAVKLECPVRKYCVNPDQVSESNFAVYVHSTCSANECPAWRWYDSPIEIHRSGYCGMAGPVKYT